MVNVKASFFVAVCLCLSVCASMPSYDEDLVDMDNEVSVVREARPNFNYKCSMLLAEVTSLSLRLQSGKLKFYISW